MTESEACALLKARFEKAGYAIAENVPFDEGGVRFDIDGFDAGKRVGYEYITDEAGDTWDVDGDVVAALDARRAAGELFVLVVAEASAPDAKALGRAADEFLATLANGGGHAAKPKKAAPKKAAPKKPAAAKKQPAAKPKARR
jgi:hypothetical protein